MKLYVGNLSFDTNDQDLRELFEQHGKPTDIFIMSDRETGRSRGFGFVTMSSSEEGQAAIDALSGKDFQGRNLTVNEARPREDHPQGGGGRSFGGNRDRGARRY